MSKGYGYGFGFGMGSGLQNSNGDLISWTNPDGNILIEERGLKLTANGGAIDWPNRVAYTAFSYNKNSFSVKFKLTSTADNASVGMSESDSTAFGSNRHGLYTEAGFMKIGKDGLQQGFFLGALNTTDEYEIRGTLGTIEYFKNGVVNAYTDTAAFDDFAIKVMFYDPSGLGVLFTGY